MTSQITKDFQMKSKLRKLADGGSPDPSMLGSGAAARAGGLLAGRGRQVDDAVSAAAGGVPTPTSAPAPAPAPEAPKKSGLRALFGLADGGSRGEGGGLSKEAVMAAIAAQRGAAPAPAPVQRPGGDYLRNPRSVLDARERAVGLVDGGRVEGPGGRTDDKVGPVMLSDEEYVLPGDTADAIGRDKLDALRLATHDFKDERKESALRGRTDDVPVDHLADGGNPWIVDSKGTVRPNAFGGAASGSGYTQPRLPPPQAGTAVATQAPPMGQRPPIDITPPGGRSAPMAQTVDAVTDVAAKTPMSRAAGLANSALRTGAPIAGIAGAAQSFDDQNTGYRDQFQRNMGVETPAGSVVADAARTLANVGDAATFGLAGRVGRGVAGAIGGDGFVKGFMGPSERDSFTQGRMDQVMGGGATGSQPSPVTAAASALRSDQGAELPVAAGSYQSRRLSQMGVPMDVQNSAPLVGANLRTAGTEKFQNLGSYGGNANIYGKADDPSRPGRINNFVGVGAGASPSNEASGSGFNSAITSALRGLGNGPSSPGGSGNSGPADNSAAINARYDKLAKELSGMYGPKGQGNLARRMLELEQSRSDALDADARNITSRSNASLQSSTLRDNAQLNARTSMIDTLGRMEQNRSTISAQVQAAQLKALQDAQKLTREGEEKGFDRYTGAIGSMFTTTGPDGKQTVDKAAQERFRSFIEGSDPQAGKKFAQMGPQEQQVLLQNFKTMFDMNETRNKTAQSGSWPSNTGGVTNRMDMPKDVREATFNDYWNNNLPMKDYLWSNLPFTNPNVVVTESGQPTLYSDYTSTDGKRDLDKEKLVQDSVKARRSSLRSN